MADTIHTSRAYWQNKDAERQSVPALASTSAPAAVPRREPLGLSSFGADEQQTFGRNLRLAMALMEDPAGCQQRFQTSHPAQRQALPDDPAAIAVRLKTLCHENASNLADQLELLVRFDDAQGWTPSGATHCCAWMNQELGIGLSLGWEYLRVGRQLRGLPITRALFRAGRLSWSMIRILCRVATADNEALLCHSALDASVSEVARLCSAYRWNDNNDGGDDAEAGAGEESQRALQQFNARSFTWRTASNGNTEFRLSLPPDLAEAFLTSIEHSLSRLDGSTEPLQSDTRADSETNSDTNSDTTMPQRRADAAVLMAEAALQSAGRELANADRYQVVINVDANELQASGGEPCTGTGTGNSISTRPGSRRPILQGHTPIARETARRHACDCTVSTVTMNQDGEPIDIGRKSRIWPAAMVRAIKARDQHCQFPGCAATRHLQIHHIEHWTDGGSTRVENGVCLCSKHHTIVHEGGYRIERVAQVAGGREVQFMRQCQVPADAPAEETVLRKSRDSFEQVRRHAPDRFRFRVVDGQGVDIRGVAHR